jgi:hypothetical protein
MGRDVAAMNRHAAIITGIVGRIEYTCETFHRQRKKLRGCTDAGTDFLFADWLETKRPLVEARMPWVHLNDHVGYTVQDAGKVMHKLEHGSQHVAIV